MKRIKLSSEVRSRIWSMQLNLFLLSFRPRRTKKAKAKILAWLLAEFSFFFLVNPRLVPHIRLDTFSIPLIGEIGDRSMMLFLHNFTSLRE
jgi:hypothetical protein